MKKTVKLLCSLLLCCAVLCLLPITASALNDRENNNTLDTAQTFTLGSTINGSISIEGDIDFYAFTLSQSGRVELNMTSYMQYYCLYLYDGNGNQLWYTDWNEWNSTVGFRNDVYSIDLIEGTYYIKATGYRSGTAVASTGTYTLATSFTNANATETESNNSVADANTLSRNGSVSGQIALNDQYDFFKVTLPKSGRLTLDMTSYMQYYCLYLYDPNGNQLWYTDWNEWNSTVGFRNDVHSLDLIEGTYYIKVTGYRSGTASASTGTYTLATAFTNANATETESNNSVADANPINLSGTVTGQIAINDPYDFYSVTLLSDRRMELRMTSYMQYYTIVIYDINGTQLWYTDWNEWNSTVGYREDSYSIDLSAGTYYIRVTGYLSGTNHASTGTYLMELNHVDAPEVTASNVASSGKVKLTWGAVDGATSYKIYRATSKNGTYKLMTTVTGTSYTNTTAKAGKTYYYYVRAVNAYGDKSVKSNIVSRTCDLARPTVTLTNVASSGKIKVSWDKVDGAVEYKVYRATSKNGTYKLVKTTTGTSYTNTSAVAGKTYYYKVVAVAEKSAANSAYSSVKSRTCDLARPDVSITRSNGKPKLTWKAVDGAVEYKIYRATSKNGTYKLVKTTKSTSFVNTGATSGKTYYYKVVAVASNSAANSAYSTVVYIKAK